MNKQAPKKIKIVKVGDKEIFELEIFRKVIRSHAGAYLVKLKPQEIEGVKIPKTEIWFPPSSYIVNEFSSNPKISIWGSDINPFLRSLQIRLL